MKVTEKQIAAVEYISRNPGANVEEIARAAGASTSGSNDAEFLRRLIDGGYVQVVLTSDVRAVLDGDADENMDEAANRFYDAIYGKV